MSKAVLANLIAQEFNYLTKAQADQIVTKVFQGITSSLESQGSFSYVGFGRLQVVDRAARKGRNPTNGTPLIISARRVITFTAGEPLKRQLNAVKKA